MGSLDGRVIGVTADRRWEEQGDLFRKRGATVMHGPTMCTVDLTDDPRLRSVTEAIVSSPPDVLIVTTGAGFRLWLETAGAWGLADAVVAGVRAHGTAVICRGAKGVSAARGAGLEVAWRSESESMEEVVEHVRATARAGSSIAMQLFDPDDHWATAAIRAVDGDLVEIPVYRWRLPDDLAPARDLVDAMTARRVNAVTFTSQPAVRNLFAIARDAGAGTAAEVTSALTSGDVLAVCVGAVCAEALVECGVTNAIWPDPPRLVAMVKLAEARLASA